jgi:hypothetical protein
MMLIVDSPSSFSRVRSEHSTPEATAVRDARALRRSG